MASDSSDIDTEQKVARSSKKKSARKTLESSDEESSQYVDCTPEAYHSSRRHSQRKRQKRFRMPSKEEQWKAISTESVSNNVSRLKPRKLVNDFTRVTHRYNHDYVEVSGEESMEEFIKDTDSPDTSDSDSEKKQSTERTHRVKGYRPRIACVSDSSEEEEGRKSETQNGSVKTSTQLSNAQEQKETVKETRKHRRKSGLDSDSDDQNQNSPLQDSQETTKRKSKRHSVLESDSENQNSESSGEENSQEIKTPRKTRMKSALDSDSDTIVDTEQPQDSGAHQNQDKTGERAMASKEEATLPKATSSQKNSVGNPAQPGASCSGVKKSSHTKEGTSSEDSSDSDENGDSGNGSDSESSDGAEYAGRIQRLAQQKRKKRESMFSQLQSARAKRLKKS